MSTAVDDLVDNAETILFDTTNARWDATELATYLSYGETAIVSRKPDAYVKHEAFILVAGTLQTVTDAVLIFDITRNMGTGGSTAGNAITRIDKAILDAALPGWHADTASATVKHWMYDESDPQRFHVYPPQPSSSFGYVDGVWSAFPAEIESGDDINLDDIYREALLDYILFRAYTKDAAVAPEAGQRASAYAQLFLNEIGSKESIEEFVRQESQARRR